MSPKNFCRNLGYKLVIDLLSVWPDPVIPTIRLLLTNKHDFLSRCPVNRVSTD